MGAVIDLPRQPRYMPITFRGLSFFLSATFFSIRLILDKALLKSSTFFEKERVIYRKDGTTKKRQKIDQREANLTSVGHFKSYHTHRLEPVENVDKTITFNVEETIKIAQEALRGWKKDKPGGTIYFGISKLTRSKTSAAKNPYLVIDVDKELIKGHGDINNPYIEHFIRQLIITTL